MLRAWAPPSRLAAARRLTQALILLALAIAVGLGVGVGLGALISGGECRSR